jgi:hypothetical protein
MSNRRKGDQAEGHKEEPGPIRFGAGADPLADRPGPIRFGDEPPPEPPVAKALDDDLDFDSGPRIALPSYITRAAQRWNPDAPVAEPKPSRETSSVQQRSVDPPSAAPPRFTPLAEFDAPAGQPPPGPEPTAERAPLVRAPPRRAFPRPEPTYPAPLGSRSPAAEEPKRYFTPLPPPGPPPAPPPPAEPAVEEKPLIEIQIHRLPPLFKGSGLMRGLFFGCALGVAVGGIAAVLLDLLQPKPQAPVILPKVVNAQAATIEPQEQASPAKARRPGRKNAAPKSYSRPSTGYDAGAAQSAIRVQTAPPPRPVLRSGPSVPIDQDAGR